MRPSRFSAVLALVGVLTAGAGLAQEALTLDQVLQPLMHAPAVRAPYVEERHMSLLSQPIVVRGELAFDPPNRLEMNVTSPQPEHLVVEGDQMAIESARTGSRRMNIRLNPAIDALMTGLRATLSGDAARLRDVFFVSVDGRPERWTLTLRPKAEQVLEVVELVRISGTGNLVDTTEIVSRNGDRTVTRLQRTP